VENARVNPSAKIRKKIRLWLAGEQGTANNPPHPQFPSSQTIK
jgi:hypothetical protein